MRAIEARLLDGSQLCRPEAIDEFRAHALEACPEECLGYIDAAGSYVRLENVSPDPARFAMSPRGVIPALMADDQLRALCHSHPHGLDVPSEGDMAQQAEMLVPFMLCMTNGQATSEPFAWGDQLLDERDLVGRKFRHGVEDCYGMIRAYFRQERGIILPDYPRNWNWWRDGTEGSKDLYRRYFAEAGFWEITREEVVPGDCFLATLRGSVPNHAGVVLDSGLCLHHASSGQAYDPTRLSRREPLVRWAPYVTHWLRR